LRIPTKYL